MDPTKCPYALLPSPPQYSSSSKPFNKQIDHQDHVRQDSLLVLGRRIHAEGTQESQSAWNHVDNKCGDEEGIKGSSSSNMLRLESPPPLQMNQKEFVPDATAKGRRTPKPSKFHADILKIGAWKWTSRYNGDLVAKFYYANHRVVWEIINEGLKMKIEIDWEHISALKFTFPEGGLGTLEIMSPRFSKETNLQLGRGTAWQRTVDFTGGQATICRRHVLQCAPWILKKHMVTLLSSNHRLYSLSQENTQQNPCYENWHSESEVLASSNAQDLYRCNDYQQFGGQKLGVPLPMSVGTDVVGRNQDGSQSIPTVTPSSVPSHSSAVTGAPSSWPQQYKTMFNHNNSSLQTDPQNLYFGQWHSESKVTGISSTQDLYPNYESGRQEFGDLASMSTGVLNPSSDPAYSSVDTSALPGGLQQHRNVLNPNNSSLQIEMQNPYFEQWKRPDVPLSSNTQDLYHSYDCHKFGGQQNDEQVPMSIQTNVCIRNHNGSQDGMPIRIPRSGSLEHSKMNGTTNARVNPRKGQNLLTSIGASANSQVQPEDVRKLVKDIIRSAKRPASPWGQQDCSVGSSSRNPMELELNNCAFNNTRTQTFEQINSSTLPRNDGNAGIAATVLERISHDLLDDDIDMEPTGMAEDAMVMSTVKSLSNLLQQDPPAPAVQNSQAIYAVAPQVDNSMLPSTASLPCEEEQIGEIEMDQEYLSEIFKFCP
ncbi:unnamed protein product [Urochloa decumbens]|uniref:TRF2/HOY1 PH-like domain-containing protein n=1 Tax=Urochloa decumbens TaxID=240449 RepID=A0ABC9BBF8_9POAL